MGVLYFYNHFASGGVAPSLWLFESAYSKCNYHLYTTIKTTDIDRLCCPDGITTTGANIFACAARLPRYYNPGVTAMSSRAGNLEAAVLVAVQQNVGQIIVNAELQEGITGACM